MTRWSPRRLDSVTYWPWSSPSCQTPGHRRRLAHSSWGGHALDRLVIRTAGSGLRFESAPFYECPVS